MKIVIATPIFPPEVDDAAQYSFELGKRLATEHTVQILTYANHPISSDGVKVQYVRKSYPTSIRLVFFTLRLFSMALRSDRILVQEIVAAGLPAVIVSIVLRKPLIVHAPVDELAKRRQQDDVQAERFKSITRLVLRRARSIIVSSHTQAELFIKQYNLQAEKFVVSYDPLSSDIMLPFAIPRIEHKIVIFAHEQSTVLDDVVQHIANLRTSYPNISLMIIGYADVWSEKEQDWITTIHKTTLEEEKYHVCSAHVCVALSAQDHRPNRVYQSLLHNVPTVVYSGHEVAELFATVPERVCMNPEQIKDKLDEYLSHKVDQSLVVYDDICKQFSWQTHIATINSTLQST